MVDLLKKGSDWLQDQLKSHASQSVTYRRGTSTATVQAVPTGFTTQVTDPEEVNVGEDAQDFLMLAADIAFGTLVVEPMRDDEIEWAGNTYQVLPPQGVPPWEWSDPYRKMRRVHAKLVLVP